MKVFKSTEMALDDFLKLPRRAQLLFFQDMTSSSDVGKGFDYWKYEISNAFSTDGCKSPIEQIMYVALSVAFADLDSSMIGTKDNPIGQLFFETQKEIHTSSGKHYYADFSVEKYNTDADDSETVLLVECDGHDFHEKTKKQVTDRNKRDLDLKMDGYDVIHFSGSQIYDDPFECAKEVIALCKKKVGKSNV